MTPKLIVHTSARLKRYRWVFLLSLRKIKKHCEEGSLYMKEKLFTSNYYYLWMWFQALGKRKDQFAAALAKHIIRINLTLGRKLPNPDMFLKYLKDLDERKHLKSNWLLFSIRSAYSLNQNCCIYWYESHLLISGPVNQYLKVISVLINHMVTNKCGLG